MRADAKPADVLRALAKTIEATFARGDWLDLALLTDTEHIVRGHRRLLRSLEWNDSDYAGNVLDVLPGILGDRGSGGSRVASAPARFPNLETVEERVGLRQWLAANEPALHEALYGGEDKVVLDDLQEASERLGVPDVGMHAARIRRSIHEDLPSSRLADKTIVVTGGSSGLGRAMSLAFAAHDADVIVADVRRVPREGGAPTDELIRARGGRARFVETDVGRWRDIDALVAEAVERGGRLDVMVNNAVVAGRHSKGLLETEEADWDAIMDVGLRGVFLCCKRAVAQMLTQAERNEARGRIINLSSQHGMVGTPGHVAYCAAKGGVVNLTRQLAVDFARRGIIVNAIAPGKILTTPLDEPDTDEVLDYSRGRTPFPRLGRPEDVAAAAVFLASDESTYISGSNLMVDGGWMAY